MGTLRTRLEPADVRHPARGQACGLWLCEAGRAHCVAGRCQRWSPNAPSHLHGALPEAGGRRQGSCCCGPSPSLTPGICGGHGAGD